MRSSPRSAPEVVLVDAPHERLVLRRVEDQFALVVERHTDNGHSVREELTLDRLAITRLIEGVLNEQPSDDALPLAPRLSDAVIHRTLVVRAEAGDSAAVRRLHLLLGEADQRETGFLSAQRALHRLAYLPIAKDEPWGCWSETLRGHGAKAYAAVRLVAMAGYVFALNAAQLEEHRASLAEEHLHHTGTEPDLAAARADMMMRVVYVLAPDRTDWREYSLQINLAARIREAPPKRARELALLTLRTLGFDGPKAHDFLKGARGSTRGWRWPLFRSPATVAAPPSTSRDRRSQEPSKKRSTKR